MKRGDHPKVAHLRSAMLAHRLAPFPARMRICLVYDCLYPYTVGGAERWYRNVAERLVAEGHEVTFLTLRQWPRGTDPEVPGLRVVPAGPRFSLYSRSGRRRVGPPLAFGLGVLLHLLRHGRRYDVVHTASFPYFSVLAAGLVRPLRGFGLVVDWHEVWSRDYWLEYLGGLGGRAGLAVQTACLRVPQSAFCFAHRTAARLREEGLRGEVTVLEGEWAGALDEPRPRPASDEVIFAGRHIPEKRVPALVAAIDVARLQAPELSCTIFGDGPERAHVLDEIARRRLRDVVRAPGFVDAGEVEGALAGALCMVLPSRREGYGLIVVEAASMGVPSVVVEEPDNAAADLISDGENGFVASSAAPADLAEAILRVRDAGPALRDSTAKWFGRNSERLSLASSLEKVVLAYAGPASARP